MTLAITGKVTEENVVPVPQGQLKEVHLFHWWPCELLTCSVGALIAQCVSKTRREKMLKQNKTIGAREKPYAERYKSLLLCLPTIENSPFTMCPESALNPDCSLGLWNLNKTISVHSRNFQAKGWGAAKRKCWELTTLCSEEQGLAKGKRRERLQQYFLHAELVVGVSQQ